MMHYGVSLVTWNLSNKCSVCWCAFIRATRHDEEYPTMCRLNSCSFAGFCVVSSGFCVVLSGFCVVLRSLFFITARQCNASETLRPNYIINSYQFLWNLEAWNCRPLLEKVGQSKVKWKQIEPRSCSNCLGDPFLAIPNAEFHMLTKKIINQQYLENW